LPRTLTPENPGGFNWIKLILVLVVGSLFFALGAGAAVFLLATFGDFPSIESAQAYRPSVASRIYDRNNRLVGEIYLERRTLVPYKTIPTNVVKAFVAAEDANFFRHGGVDYVAIVRAVLKDILAGEFAQGASTITQQTVKSLFLTPEKSISRKVKEIILAYRIEKKLSKEEILYLYLNQIYLGEGAYGVEAAAQTYFGRGVSTLRVAEGALLAGLAQAPTSTGRRRGSGTSSGAWRRWGSSGRRRRRRRTTPGWRSRRRRCSVPGRPTSWSTCASTSRRNTGRRRSTRTR
jgi:penicillin-binding protein 1A